MIGVATDGTPPESPFRTARDRRRAAAAFGYIGVPLAVIIDRAGVLRGLAAPRHADDLFALAAPVLLESDFVGVERARRAGRCRRRTRTVSTGSSATAPR